MSASRAAMPYAEIGTAHEDAMTTTVDSKLPSHLAPVYHAIRARRLGLGLAQAWLEAIGPEKTDEAWSQLTDEIGGREDGKWVTPVTQAQVIALARHLGWACRR